MEIKFIRCVLKIIINLTRWFAVVQRFNLREKVVAGTKPYWHTRLEVIVEKPDTIRWLPAFFVLESHLECRNRSQARLVYLAMPTFD